MDTISGTTVPAGRTTVQVAVAADHALVAESVRAALENLGYRVSTLRPGLSAVPARRRRETAGGRDPREVDVALLVSELGRPERIRAAQVLIGSSDVSWLVLTGAAQGPAWGALYDRGAALVVPSTTGLHDVSELLFRLSRGWTPRGVGLRRGELVGAWRSFSRDRLELARRLDLLTEREDVVLGMLSDGVTVREIAVLGAVSETTVRSQVKAILRKLRVRSQIAAVAAFRELRPDEGTP